MRGKQNAFLQIDRITLLMEGKSAKYVIRPKSHWSVVTCTASQGFILELAWYVVDSISIFVLFDYLKGAQARVGEEGTFVGPRDSSSQLEFTM